MFSVLLEKVSERGETYLSPLPSKFVRIEAAMDVAEYRWQNRGDDLVGVHVVGTDGVRWEEYK